MYVVVGVSVDAICSNGGTCRDVGASHRCECRLGFDGSYCDQDVDECRSQPCRNGARCVDLIGRYHCDCPLGFQVPISCFRWLLQPLVCGTVCYRTSLLPPLSPSSVVLNHNNAFQKTFNVFLERLSNHCYLTLCVFLFPFCCLCENYFFG